VFHPTFGFPGARRSSVLRFAVDGAERALDRVMPEWSRAYVHVRAFRSVE
jgi:hypothetical protein